MVAGGDNYKSLGLRPDCKQVYIKHEIILKEFITVGNIFRELFWTKKATVLMNQQSNIFFIDKLLTHLASCKYKNFS
ncbi:hypothetical protein EB796_016306 [Bugula neritina]|uniref:Uncharacterized protein n=1 Tax=Bugula neritina TaxID=10212 RepID=A0A7J7JGC6_BUGNE|nr:hypothetical protein EB796_016306 [Bugula neritina]